MQSEKGHAHVMQVGSISILHLSDLHMGLKNQALLWPTFKKAFFDDLVKLHSKNGPWDVVLFTGDLTQCGIVEEFQQLTNLLRKIWSLFDSLGFSPVFVPIPGNHDLMRPDELNAASRVLLGWWDEPKLRDVFWSESNSEYRKLVDAAFGPYRAWINGLKSDNFPLANLRPGLIPGDSSTVISANGLNVGIVGLNSAWLHLSNADFQGRLHVDQRQLLAVTDNDPDRWCEANDLNILVTHHPTTWLHPKSRELWRSEIDTNDRFTCHLFGHMHEPQTTSLSEGGSNYKRAIQAASLFGLEKIPSGEKRIHGFSLFAIGGVNEEVKIRIWPRRALEARDGTRKLIPDHEFNLGDNDSFELTTSAVALNAKMERRAPTVNVVAGQQAHATNLLESIRRSVHASSSHREIRRMELSASISALQERRALWIVSDWGLGTDEFIGSLQLQLPVDSSYILEIDAHPYRSRAELLAGVHDQLGCSFEQLCELISLEAACVLVLDVAIGEGDDKSNLSLQRDIEVIAEAVLQYCENVRLIIKSRRAPNACEFKMVELRPLDEADTAVYIAENENGGKFAATPQFVSQVYRHTDGIPSRIDAILRDVPIVGTSALYSLNPDVSGRVAVPSSIAPGLVASLSDMKGSHDPAVKRAYDLLKAMAMFPRGQQFATLKRFNGPSGFYSGDARILMNWAFTDAVEVPHVNRRSSTEDGRALVVRRPVREYLYSALPPSELRSLNRRALALYFGDDWSVKGLNPPRHLNFSDRNCGNWQIGNASMMVLRAAREAVEAGSVLKVKAALNLGTSFCASLLKGDHYGSVVSLCNELVPIFKEFDGGSIDLVLLRSQWGRSMRMGGENETARAIFEELRTAPVAKTVLQEILLSLALCYEALEEGELAISTAKECIKIDPDCNRALQAQSIVVGLETEDPQRDKKLRKIENDARKKKAFIVANNMTISRAIETTDVTEKKQLLETVVYGAGKDDHNRMRALIDLARLSLQNGEEIQQATLAKLVDAYHYLYGESFKTLFNTCHNVLWQVFERSGETTNLMRLFRYSSLTWRLRGEPKRERDYLVKLGKVIGRRKRIGFGDADREMAYFLARTGQVMSEQSANKKIA